jgi:hypothetical protein
MKSQKLVSLLLALAAVVALSAPSIGQSVTAERAFTEDEIGALKDVTGAFCLWLNNAIKEGIPRPEGNLKLSPTIELTPAEMDALYPKCDQLMRLMQQAIDAHRKPIQGPMVGGVVIP